MLSSIITSLRLLRFSLFCSTAALMIVCCCLCEAAATTQQTVVYGGLYTIIATNKTNETIHAEYVRPRATDLSYFLDNSTPWDAPSKHRIPIWHRNGASDHDDRIVHSPIFDNFSMPFFEMRQHHHNSAAGASGSRTDSRSVANGTTLLISSNGFLTPSLQGHLCSGYFCHDYYFPYANRSINFEVDIVPMVSLLSYDLDPRASPSRAPISAFLVGDCVDELAPGEHYTTNADKCDSVVVDFDRVPEFNTNATAPQLSAQVQLFRNGTIIFRYLGMPVVTAVPWYFAAFGYKKAHPSCGLLMNNVEQIANATPFCTDATPLSGGTPLYTEIQFVPVPETPQHARCSQQIHCAGCAKTTGCTWCEGAVPHSSDQASSTGRCVPESLAIGTCGPFPFFAVSNNDTASSRAIIPDSTPTCEAMPVAYARQQQPYRSVWYANDVGATVQEWRFGVWTTNYHNTSATKANMNHGGGDTVLPKWHANLDYSLAAKFGSTGLTKKVRTPDDRNNVLDIPKSISKRILPSIWWRQISCDYMAAATVKSPTVYCRDASTRQAFQMHIYNAQGVIRGDSLTHIRIPAMEFSSSAPPPHEYCIARSCDELKNTATPCASAAPGTKRRCDSFDLLTWRGQVVPSTNGTYTFTLSFTVGEFGHLLSSLEIQSPLANIVPNVLPKDNQHLFMDFDGGRFSAPMRRWAGSGLTAAWIPVTMCPPCSLGQTCDPLLGSCSCSLKFDSAQLCTRCLPGNVERQLVEERLPAGTPAVLAVRCVSCPRCRNGGTCDNTTGECICPMGYDGALCDIKCNDYADRAAAGMSCGVCGRDSKSTCICGRCVKPLWFSPIAGKDGEEMWVKVLGWFLVAAIGVCCLYMTWSRIRNKSDDEHGIAVEDLDSSSSSSSPMMRRRRGGRRVQLSFRGRTVDAWVSDSDEEEMRGGDNNNNGAVDSNNNVDGILRGLPPKMREQFLLPIVNSSRGTKDEAKWTQRLEEARREMNKKSNPLGIALDRLMSPSHNNNNNRNQQQHDDLTSSSTTTPVAAAGPAIVLAGAPAIPIPRSLPTGGGYNAPAIPVSSRGDDHDDDDDDLLGGPSKKPTTAVARSNHDFLSSSSSSDDDGDDDRTTRRSTTALSAIVSSLNAALDAPAPASLQQPGDVKEEDANGVLLVKSSDGAAAAAAAAAAAVASPPSTSSGGGQPRIVKANPLTDSGAASAKPGEIVHVATLLDL